MGCAVPRERAEQRQKGLWVWFLVCTGEIDLSTVGAEWVKVEWGWWNGDSNRALSTSSWSSDSYHLGTKEVRAGEYCREMEHMNVGLAVLSSHPGLLQAHSGLHSWPRGECHFTLWYLRQVGEISFEKWFKQKWFTCDIFVCVLRTRWGVCNTCCCGFLWASIYSSANQGISFSQICCNLWILLILEISISQWFDTMLGSTSKSGSGLCHLAGECDFG